MRIFRSHLPFVTSCVVALSAPSAAAQEPETPPPPTAPAATENAPPAAEAPARRPRRQTLVVEAGTVHPVAGPAILDGVVVVRGDRIVAIGKKGEVEVPPNAVVRSFPTGHVYPGLIDAATDAYTDQAMRADGSLDAGAPLADDLRLRGDRDDELAKAGITTAYVTVRSPSVLRGQGAIVRPQQQGFELWPGREHAGVQLRMTNGPGATHALQRQQQIDGASALFDGLDEFRKARTDHDEALKKYTKEFEDYLAWHQKKKDAAKPPEKEGDKPANAPPAGAPTTAPGPEGRPAGGPGGRGGRGNRGGGGNEPPKDDPKPNGGGGNGSGTDLELLLATLLDTLAVDASKQDPPKQDPPKPQEPPKTGQGPAPQGPPGAQGGAPAAEKKDEGPKRPTYPKAPPRDPQKEALLRVLDGAMPLRVEAHRPDELRGALQLQRTREIPLLVLEQAYGAAAVAEEIAKQGASVVLTEVLPNSLPEIYEAFDPTAVPARLQAAGVPFAIATGSARRAGLLPMMAAAAVGKGLDRQAALRAITLTPAEILGIAKDTGSLQAGKYADLMVCDRPLFASDSRVLFVLAQGRTQYEAK